MDTCCIDQSSSAEVSEAINSMFAWYRNAAICYVFLADVNFSKEYNGFEESKWFERGWTLQELIAPRCLEFYDCNWELIGTKADLREVIFRITNVDPWVLHGGDISQISVGRRMSWASDRKTSRIEDKAYCLLGIFDVNMPLLYGEKEKAFIRLQEEILEHTNDATIFSWNSVPEHVCHQNLEGFRYLRSWDNSKRSLLAPAPASFRDCPSWLQEKRHGDANAHDEDMPPEPGSIPVIPNIKALPSRFVDWIAVLDEVVDFFLESVSISNAAKQPSACRFKDTNKRIDFDDLIDEMICGLVSVTKHRDQVNSLMLLHIFRSDIALRILQPTTRSTPRDAKAGLYWATAYLKKDQLQIRTSLENFLQGHTLFVGEYEPELQSLGVFASPRSFIPSSAAYLRLVQRANNIIPTFRSRTMRLVKSLLSSPEATVKRERLYFQLLELEFDRPNRLSLDLYEDLTWKDRFCCAVEGRLGKELSWWPLERPRKLMPAGDCRLYWRNVCHVVKFRGVDAN
jgi:hypothetical protein